MPRLTVESIRNEPKPKVRRRKADSAARGLYLYIETSGMKRWVLRYKAPGPAAPTQHKHTLGLWAEPILPAKNPEGRLSLAEARSVTLAWRERLRRGEYPHEIEAREREREELERRADSDALTVKALGQEFHDRYLVQNTKRPAERLVAFNKWVVRGNGGIGNLKIRDVTERDLVRVLERVEDADRHVTAHTLARLLRQMFKWAVRRKHIKENPADGLEAGSPYTKRDRVLTDDEIRSLWVTLDREDLPMSTAIRLGLKVLLVTAARSGELAAAKWADVGYAGDMPQWTIPAQATKEGKTHLVPLGRTAAGLFRELHKLTGDSEFVMPARERVRGAVRLGERKKQPLDHLDSHAIATALRRTILFLRESDELKFEPFGAHDLRRTLRTGLSRLGVDGELAERVIGHAIRNSLVATYDTYDRLKERREALLKWDREVRRILDAKPGDKVRAIKSGRL